MDKRHPILPGVTARATIDVQGLIKTRGASAYAPLTQQKVCRVELEVDEMDITVMAYDDLADQLAKFAATTFLRVRGELHIAKWGTGDGKIHQRMGVHARSIDESS